MEGPPAQQQLRAFNNLPSSASALFLFSISGSYGLIKSVG